MFKYIAAPFNRRMAWTPWICDIYRFEQGAWDSRLTHVCMYWPEFASYQQTNTLGCAASYRGWDDYLHSICKTLSHPKCRVKYKVMRQKYLGQPSWGVIVLLMQSIPMFAVKGGNDLRTHIISEMSWLHLHTIEAVSEILTTIAIRHQKSVYDQWRAEHTPLFIIRLMLFIICTGHNRPCRNIIIVVILWILRNISLFDTCFLLLRINIL